MRSAAFITGLSLAALALTGCSSATTTSEKATVTETVSAAPTSAAASATPSAPPSVAANSGLPQPPAGAAQLETKNDNGVQFARYSVTGQQPQQVVDYYTGVWQGQGYTITSSGGGGGYGQYGGSGAGATGAKPDSFVAVHAGGQNGQATYFSVCQGTDQQAVRQCSDNNNGG